jgi:hypothetical protein
MSADPMTADRTHLWVAMCAGVAIGTVVDVPLLFSLAAVV